MPILFYGPSQALARDWGTVDMRARRVLQSSPFYSVPYRQHHSQNIWIIAQWGQYLEVLFKLKDILRKWKAGFRALSASVPLLHPCLRSQARSCSRWTDIRSLSPGNEPCLPDLSMLWCLYFLAKYCPLGRSLCGCEENSLMKFHMHIFPTR